MAQLFGNEMAECKKCFHECHCNQENHIDEYKDICACSDCDCKKTYKYEKEHGTDITYENEVRQKR